MERTSEISGGRVCSYSLCILASLFFSAYAFAAGNESDLVAAAAGGDLSRVKTLLAAKVSANARGEDGVTALMAASHNGYEEVVGALLDAKADANARTSNGTTALMRAATTV